MAIFFGLLLRYLNHSCVIKCLSLEVEIWLKMFILLFLSVFFPWFSIYTGFHECKYIGIIFTGYFCNKWWEDKPDELLSKFWIFCQPFLFGVVGASIRFNEIGGDMIGKGLLIILGGVCCRLIAVVLVTFETKYVFKERIFMACAWLPKATVQAAISGIVLLEARDNGLVVGSEYDYETAGRAIVTTAVFAIIITAPMGAILTNTLGPMWLIKG